MQQKTLTIFAIGGLCNRLKPIFSGMDIARRTGRRLRIYWDRRFWNHSETLKNATTIGDWPGSFSDLFSTPIEEVEIEEVLRIRECSSEWNNPETNPWDMPLIDQNDERPDILRCSWQFLRLPIDNVYDVIIDKFDERLIAAFKTCQPISSIKKTINSFGDRSVAVHIRSQHYALRHLTAPDYIRAIEQYASDPIFIASDSTKIEKEILKIFPNAVALPKLSYDFIPCLRSGDTIADLFLLSRADILIGTPRSTFAHVAWYLGGCRAKFIEVNNDNLKC